MSDLEAAVDELRTLADLIRWGASRFNEAELVFGHGTDNALDEAWVLALHALSLPWELPERYLDTRLTGAERRAVAELMMRRLRERKPAAYLTGVARFAGLPFRVDERALVPRSPIAELIEEGFQPWLDPGAVRRVLDLGTGGGCIAVACAHALPGATVDAVDVDAAALELARENVQWHGVEDRVRVLTSDLFGALNGERYDLVVGNPPYVDAAAMAELPAEYRAEPAQALAAGEDGLDVVRRILREAPEHLTDDGVLVVEVGRGAGRLERAFPRIPFTWLAFRRGGEGVFLLTAEELRAAGTDARQGAGESD